MDRQLGYGPDVGDVVDVHGDESLVVLRRGVILSIEVVEYRSSSTRSPRRQDLTLFGCCNLLLSRHWGLLVIEAGAESVDDFYVLPVSSLLFGE